MDATPKPRRAGRLGTILLLDGVIALLGTGGILGFVAADYHDYGDIPVEFEVPPAREGDLVVYEYDFEVPGQFRGSLPDQEPIRTRIAYQWLSPSEIRDGNGKGVAVQRLSYGGEASPFNTSHVLFIEVGTHRSVGSSYRHQMGPFSWEMSQHVALESNWTYYGMAPCGAENALQGHRIQIHRVVALTWNCMYLGGFQAGPGAQLFRAVAVKDDGGRQAVVFALEGGAPPVNLWFRGDIPYPTRIVTQSANGTAKTTRLMHFEAGHTPLPQEPREAKLPAATPLAWAAATPTGPSEEGLSHPFPLSAAVAFARREAGEPVKRLLRSSDGFLEAADYTEWRYEQEIHRKWWFSATDGSERVQVGVVQNLDASPLAPLLGTTGLRFENSTTRLVGHSLRPGPDSPMPTKDVVPARMPTVASLFGNWESRNEPGAEPNAWSFLIGPSVAIRSGDDQGGWSFTYGAGRVDMRDTAAPPPSLERTKDDRHALASSSFDADGQLSFYTTDLMPANPGPDPVRVPENLASDGGKATTLQRGEPVTNWRMPYGPFLAVAVVATVLVMAYSWWRHGLRAAPR